MATSRTCTICDLTIENVDLCEHASVRSNIRRFMNESFVMWRCPHCRSIHAKDEVDLNHYYANYPFHKLVSNPLLRHFHNKMIRRLKRAGLKRHHRVIDYGCGSGLFVDHLKSKGYLHIVGFDTFSERFNDQTVLQDSYDFVFSQDVIEHVADPRKLLRTFHRLAKPGGVIAIGTPNASAIDLAHPHDTIHALHAPYHRTILSKGALLNAGQKLGWELTSYYPAAYANTYLPGVNARMWVRYCRTHDNTIDLAFEPPRLSLRFLTPLALFDLFLGGLFCPELDIMALFRNTDRSTSVTSD